MDPRVSRGKVRGFVCLVGGSKAGSTPLHLKLSHFLPVLLYSAQVVLPFCCSRLTYADSSVDVRAWERQRALLRWWEVVCLFTVPTIFYGRRPTVSFSLCRSLCCHNLEASLLPPSSDSSCSSTSSHLSLLCLSLPFRSVLELFVFEWERGNACVFVFEGRVKPWLSWPGFTLLEQSYAA